MLINFQAFDCSLDALIAGAPAQIALKVRPDSGLFRVGIVFKKGINIDDHAGCAVTALETIVRHKSLFEGLVFYPFDGGDPTSDGLDRKHQAGFDRYAVELHGAGAAVAVFATEFGSGQAGLLPDDLGQGGGGVEFHAALFTIKDLFRRDDVVC